MHLRASAFADARLRVDRGARAANVRVAASDIFLGWVTGRDGCHYHLRQLRDMKISELVEGWSSGLLRASARTCAHALARAHARSGDAARIAGYAGASRTLDDAFGEFAVDCADRNRADYRTFVRAIREGRSRALMDA